jgi:SAM-dependent methyltransferase
LVAVGLAGKDAPGPLGVDPDPRAEHYCRRNGVDFLRLEAGPGLDSLPEGAFGFVTALDVVEHLDDPRPAVEAIRRRLAPGAVCVLTAPAFPELRSQWDETLGHRRRYRLGELRELCRAGGLRVLWSSCLFSYAFLPALAMRRGGKAGGKNAEFPKTGRAANAALGAISALERAALKLFPLPLGTSAMVVAVK